MNASGEAEPRAAVVRRVAERITGNRLPHPTRVAVDGVTASGKTTLARELTGVVRSLGRPAIHLTMDGFHHPRARRHRRGRDSAVGYYEDAYDLDGFAREVLIPLGPGRKHRYRASILDLVADRPVHEPPLHAAADAVLIVDGTFLQRSELRDHWDERLWLNTTFPVARRRGVERDAVTFGSVEEAERLYELRYHAACRLYVQAIRPAEQATMIFDNDDPGWPRLVLR